MNNINDGYIACQEIQLYEDYLSIDMFVQEFNYFKKNIGIHDEILTEGAKELFSTIKRKIKETWEKIKTFLKNIKDKIVAFFKKIFSKKDDVKKSTNKAVIKSAEQKIKADPDKNNKWNKIVNKLDGEGFGYIYTIQDLDKFTEFVKNNLTTEYKFFIETDSLFEKLEQAAKNPNISIGDYNNMVSTYEEKIISYNKEEWDAIKDLQQAREESKRIDTLVKKTYLKNISLDNVLKIITNFVDDNVLENFVFVEEFGKKLKYIINKQENRFKLGFDTLSRQVDEFEKNPDRIPDAYKAEEYVSRVRQMLSSYSKILNIIPTATKTIITMISNSKNLLMHCGYHTEKVISKILNHIMVSKEYSDSEKEKIKSDFDY